MICQDKSFQDTDTQLNKREPHYNKAKQKFIADQLEDVKQIEASVKNFLQQIEL
jgi:hypothetical protein